MSEMRLSDVVRGLKVTNKSVSQDVNETQHANVAEDTVSKPDPVTQVAKPAPVTPQTVEPPVSRLPPRQPLNLLPPPAASLLQKHLHHYPPPTSDLGSRKLSYAEVCQRLAKDPPPAQTPSPSPSASSPSQPLQELKVNWVEEPRPNPNPKRTTNKPEKSGDSRPPRQPLRSSEGRTAKPNLEVRG
ncbi:hypothetical protein D5F01_LYC03176 [Larimichthys crocea]|uniref:Uncharacterized protein n=1 Tax=Larimichthys crocea TaxID=215358 RepID=A0A6G0J5D1_LARCR|nr:hypothetical protein D5F01_LYC03176 [Larimichthys crocea]